MNVIFTCGGTGGHIMPAISVANIWKERHPDSNILFIGGKGNMEEELVPADERANFIAKLEEVMLGQFADILPTQKGLSGRILKKQAEKIASQFEGLYELTDEQAKKVKLGGGTTLYYFKEMGEHPAPAYLEKLEKPVLILQGSRDFQVKLREDYDAYRALLEGRPNVTFKLYEGLNHAFVPAVYGNIAMAKKEYGIEQHIGGEVIGDLADWIHSNC